MKKQQSFVILCYLTGLFFILNTGISFSVNDSSKDVVIPSSKSPNVIRVTSDSLVLVSGTTYRFTVDTPEDHGLVSTGINVGELKNQLCFLNNSALNYKVYNDKDQLRKEDEILSSGDRLEVAFPDKKKKQYYIRVEKGALSGQLILHQKDITINTNRELELDFIAGQRSPMATVHLYIPKGITVDMENTTVNVIGRGEVKLSDLEKQSIGRTGTNYSYKQVAHVSIVDNGNAGQIIEFSKIDLRPFNGVDLKVRIKNVKVGELGKYVFKAIYTTTEPKVYASHGTVMETETLNVVPVITDLKREALSMFSYKEAPGTYSGCTLSWTPPAKSSEVVLMQSVDNGKSWSKSEIPVRPDQRLLNINNLQTGILYAFKLLVKDGDNKGESNCAWVYTGKLDVKTMGVKGDGIIDDTDSINAVIEFMNGIGGGTLLFSEGKYNVRTVQLKSNVWLYVDKDAVIQALPGGDAPEPTWFSDKAYRSGLSPTDPKPYKDPENYLTKQDVGHTFFRNCMFFAGRQENIKITGNGRITGNGNLVTGDKVMDNPPDKRADKMFTFKLCTNIEIGGEEAGKDLWYDEEKDEPYYIDGKDKKNFDVRNMLHIDRGGHFVLLATGTDRIHVHDTYFGKADVSNSRDIYDFMACNDVTVTNIYSRVSSDDIVKPGSDCSLGFTRPVKNYRIRNIIGDTNCNLFQIGSETADDIQDLYVDNIYVLGSNKAGFSISTNDGAHIKNVYLNSGKTGPLHSRSKMLRTRAPFFISISNRARVLGADVKMFTFTENGTERKELLCTNVNIGIVENVIINGLDIAEVYAGSSFRGERWKAFDGTQNEATPIIAGYKLPDENVVEGSLNFNLPNGLHTGYIKNVQFTDINMLVKGGHPVSDAKASPPEIGVGRYNVGDMKIQPAYGFWARHVKGFKLKDCIVNYEKSDGRHAVVLDDVIGAEIETLKVPETNSSVSIIKEINSSNIIIKK